MSDNPFADLFKGFKIDWEGLNSPASLSTQSVRSRPSFWNPFRSWRDEEVSELTALYDEVHHAFKASPFADEALLEKSTKQIVVAVFDTLDCSPPRDLLGAIIRLTDLLLADEFFSFREMGNGDWASKLDMQQAQDLKQYLGNKHRFLVDAEKLYQSGCQTVAAAVVGLTELLPFEMRDDDRQEHNPEAMHFDVEIIDVIERPESAIESTILTFFGQDIYDTCLFLGLRSDFERRLSVASGVDPDSSDLSDQNIILPTHAKGKTVGELAHLYLNGTPFEAFFNSFLSLRIPDQARFEHCHIIGGTGHGKTQCLQYLIHEDMVRAIDENVSLVVIDSQGDLIRKLSSNAMFEPGHEGWLAERFILIDPSDIEHPPALNLFDPGLERMADCTPRQEELAFNSLVDIYGRFFGALLGAELTARQNTVFRYLARLMLTVPDATIHTLIDLMDDLTPFKQYISELDPTARRFFEKEFASSSFRATRGQIKQRLYAVLSIPTFDRLFSAKKSKINFFDALNDGKIILINTAKDLLKQDGTAIFGRFILALIEHAIMERATLPEEDRNPVFLYIDEAQDYFDDTVETLLVQARKYNCGLILAHQTLAQLSPRLKAVFASNTTIKLAGGVSDSDARAMAPDMRTTSDFLLSMRKRAEYSEFALSVRNLTSQALKVEIPLGFLENKPLLKGDQHVELLDRNQLQIGYTPEIEPEPVEALPPVKEETTLPAASPEEKSKARKTHREVQESIKLEAQQLGFSASIEKQVLDGKGRIDVAIETPRLRIACEISVTTRADHEQHNIEKCLAAGYDEVWMISPDPKQLQSLAEILTNSLPKAALENTSFLSEHEVLERLSALATILPAHRTTYLGYEVSVVSVLIGKAKSSEQRDRLAAVLTTAQSEVGDPGEGGRS